MKITNCLPVILVVRVIAACVERRKYDKAFQNADVANQHRVF
jgi:hypothetical protein